MEDFEKKIITANQLQADLLQKAMNGENLDSICKGKVAAMGEIRDWKGQKYQKTPGGWIPVKNQGGSKKEEKPGVASEDTRNISQIRSLISSGKEENIQRAKKIFDNLDTATRDKIPKELTSKMGIERTNPERDEKNLEQSTKEFKELKSHIDRYGVNEKNVNDIIGRFNALSMTDDPTVEKKIKTWGKSLIKKQELSNKEAHDRNQSTWDAAQKNPQSRKWPFGETATVESIDKKNRNTLKKLKDGFEL